MVIAGAGRGVGRSLATALAKRGARLALSDVDIAGVADTVGRCEKLGATAVPYVLDLADRAAVYSHVDDVLDDFGSANLVINNAGSGFYADVLEMDWDDFDRVMKVDFWGVAHSVKAFLPHLIDSGDGHIVNVSSGFGPAGIPSQSACNAARLAVRGFTEALRQEIRARRYPVGVTCVYPGGIKTNGGADGRRVPRGVDCRSDTVARIILRGVQRNTPRVLIDPDVWFIDAIPRVIGPHYQDIVGS